MDAGARVRAAEVRNAEQRRDTAARDEERAARRREDAQRDVERAERQGSRIDRYA